MKYHVFFFLLFTKILISKITFENKRCLFLSPIYLSLPLSFIFSFLPISFHTIKTQNKYLV